MRQTGPFTKSFARTTRDGETYGRCLGGSSATGIEGVERAPRNDSAQTCQQDLQKTAAKTGYGTSFMRAFAPKRPAPNIVIVLIVILPGRALPAALDHKAIAKGPT